jgi:hypothetical protein
MGTCPRSTRMICVAAVMHLVIGSCSSVLSKKRGKARAEIVKMLQVCVPKNLIRVDAVMESRKLAEWSRSSGPTRHSRKMQNHAEVVWFPLAC